jgi:hypothetical protein
MEITFDRIGKLLSEPNKDWFVKVVDDRQGSTGGLYLYTFENIDGSGIFYDDWYETVNQLELYFQDTSIEWLETK